MAGLMLLLAGCGSGGGPARPRRRARLGETVPVFLRVPAGDVDLDIADGEFLVLVGPSGCGTSTALRVVNTLSLKDRRIAMVFQSYALYPHMSVADNIAYGLRIRRMDKAEIDRRVNKVMDEPLSNLDAKLRVQMRSEIAQVSTT